MLQLHGSGKTAVLVERIINKILNENIDIDKILVVTFTNAAASEMRERILEAIYKKLEENPNDEKLQRQITLLNKASICTIDSFCLDVVKNNFYNIDISPNFRIADTAEIQLLKQEVLEELFEIKYENQDKVFINLINTYTSYKDDIPLKELILKIYSFIQSSPFPKKWLKEKVEMFNLKDVEDKDFSNTVWGKLLLEELEEEITDNIASLLMAKQKISKYDELKKFKLVLEEDIEQLQNLKNNLNSWDKSYYLASQIKFGKWPIDKKINYEEKDLAKEIRDNVKKKLKKQTDKILVFDSKSANEDIINMYNTLKNLELLIKEFDEAFLKIKREKNIVDFNDIEHFALDILLNVDNEGNIQKSDVAKMYQEKFAEIAIDEYQDSNLVQEYILTSVSNGKNIFMVGDVKQSIYKFRQARPELFLEKYAKYKLKENKEKDEDLKIQLFKNFRSRENILKFTNVVFENIMSYNLGDIEYNQEEFLNLGADYKNVDQNLNIELNIIDLKEKLEEKDFEEETQETEQIIENIELEAKLVSKKIKELIKNKYQVYDVKKEEFRDITYKDIVILLRSTKDIAPVFEKELINLNMPVFCDASLEYLDSIEIKTIMSILKIIDNPLQDIPLVICLRSAIGGFTDNDLVEIRLQDKQSNFYNAMLNAKDKVDNKLRNKIESFINNINKWKQEQEYLTLDELIWTIYTDTGYFNYVGLMPNGELRQANLKILFERAKQYEEASFKGLFNFINFIEKLQLGSGDLGAAKLIGENENVIRIMSIHKSKGLEFPVVFLANTGKQFNLMDLNNNILLHQDIGLGVKYINYDKQIEYNTLSKYAIRNKLYKEILSEEMRVLYVGLTRAKEKLYITGISKDYNIDIKNLDNIINSYTKINKKINPIIVKKFKRYLDWFLLIWLYNKKELERLIDLNIIDKKDLLEKNKEVKEDINIINLLEKEEVNKEDFNKVKNILEFDYKYKLLTTLPTKTSVTNIKQMKLEKKNQVIYENQENFYEENKDGLEDSLSFVKPKFLNNSKKEVLTNAQKGTVMHLCFQRLNENINYTKDDIYKLINDLYQKEIITELEKESINIDKIYNFVKNSFIWKDLQEAKEVQKEKPFYMNILSQEIHPNDELGENILVQGIIDLYYIDKNDKLVLVDYKTDYVQKGKEYSLVEKYKEQINLYQRALEQALNKKVDKKYIYSIYLNQEIPID